MKQVIQNYRTGKIGLEDVPIPLCKAGGALVKNISSLVSVGTEKLMIDLAQKSLLGKAMARPDLVRLVYEKAKKEGFINVFKEAMNRLDEPVPLGYCSAGIIVEVGEGVRRFNIGDKVACAGAGFASHAEVVWVPESLCMNIPEGIGFDEASFAMLGAIALHGIRCAELTFGETVCVIGLGLVGLLTVQILNAYGCKVVGFDINETRCRLAKSLVPEVIVENEELAIEKKVDIITKGCGADAIIICASTKDNRPIQLAEKISRPKARIVLVGVSEIKPTRKTFWEKELQFTVSRAAGPGVNGRDYSIGYVRWTEKRNIEEFLSLVASGKVNTKKLVSHRFRIDDALEAYEMILNNKEPFLGVIFEYPGQVPIHKKLTILKQREEPGSIKTEKPLQNIGFIGGGAFTKNILLPALEALRQKNTPGVVRHCINGIWGKQQELEWINLVGIVTTSGVTANHIAKKFGFKYCTTDYKEILQDNTIDSIFITTPHNLHSKMVIESLEAGKNVFVEKPLCITEEELREIAKTCNRLKLINSLPKLMMGFNRRYSPLASKARESLKNRATPLLMHYRVNAGYIPPEHWTQNPEIGGGRIIGEICHFVDFFQFLTDSYPVSVYAESIDGGTGKFLKEDNLAVTIKFSDGSLGSLLYTAKGSKAFPREYVEVFSDEAIVVIDNFRSTLTISGNKREKTEKWSQDLGYVEELKDFFNPASNIPVESYIYTTMTTFRIAESLHRKKTMKVDIEDLFTEED